jgi:hypothetical protein
VREVTGWALGAATERGRIEPLTLIDGVQWPMASVLLHIFHSDPYPILDFRALWSVDSDVPAVYTFEFWWVYVTFCRATADANGVDMRTLDRALWQYSKENQPETRARPAESAPQGPLELRKGSPIVEPGTVCWVSCVGQKLSSAAPAKDLYTSDWFTKARRHVESTGVPWFILSAKYGLVRPDEVIEPYELTLNTLGVEDRRRWAERVKQQLATHGNLPTTVVMLAGARYREHLEPYLTSAGVRVEVPMEGLRIGEQLRWLGHAQSLSPKPRSRRDDLRRFYELLDRLERRQGGKRTLAVSSGQLPWPRRGVYFFFEPGEMRLGSGNGLRVVRVGTHALTVGSSSTLWGRLAQHRGVADGGGGNHRGSIFRLVVGAALKQRDALAEPKSWGVAGALAKAAQIFGVAPASLREMERPLESAVSDHIGRMPFLYLAIDDEPGPASLRGEIERNAIALLSNFERESVDPASSDWLGGHSDRERVRASGLWNNNYVDEGYALDFLDTLERLIDESPHQRSGG